MGLYYNNAAVLDTNSGILANVFPIARIGDQTNKYLSNSLCWSPNQQVLNSILFEDMWGVYRCRWFGDQQRHHYLIHKKKPHYREAFKK